MENMTETETATAEKFTVHDEASAGWVLRKMAAIEAEQARIKAQCAARIAELEADSRALHSRFDSELQAWAETEAARRKRKTITLLDGTLTFRTAPRKLIIADNEAAFVHARTAFSHCIKTEIVPESRTVTLDAAAYIAEAERTGELLPGMDAVPERETFKVDVAGAKPKGKAELPN